MNKDTYKRMKEYEANIEAKRIYICQLLDPPKYSLECETTKLGRQTIKHNPEFLTLSQSHVLIACLLPVRYFNLLDKLMKHNAPVTEHKALVDVVARLVSRGYLELLDSEEQTQESQEYEGKLVVSSDGTITFVPKDDIYHQVFSCPLLTIKTSFKDIPPYKPIMIDLKNIRK